MLLITFILTIWLGYIGHAISQHVQKDLDICSFTLQDGQKTFNYNLNGMQNYHYTAEDSKHTYTMDFCKLSTDSKCAEQNQGSICVYNSGVFSKSIGSFLASPQFIVSKYKDENNAIHPQITFSNAITYSEDDLDSSLEGNIQTVITLKCNLKATQKTIQMSEIYTSYYRGTLETPFGCDGYTEPTSSGLSTGWIFIIIVCSILAVYLAIGIYISVKKHGKSGLEAVPHYTFWKAIPAYTVAGVKTTYFFIRSKLTKQSINSSYESYTDTEQV